MESQLINPWQFDSSVAIDFANYARRHIPNYDEVIDMSIDICRDFDKSSKIIDPEKLLLGFLMQDLQIL
jgi:hypothetical protein